MTVPLWARSIAALIGGLLVLAVWANVIKTLIVPRPLTHGLGIRVARTVNRIFRLAAGAAADYHGRDRVRSGQASAILLASHHPPKLKNALTTPPTIAGNRGSEPGRRCARGNRFAR